MRKFISNILSGGFRLNPDLLTTKRIYFINGISLLNILVVLFLFPINLNKGYYTLISVEAVELIVIALNILYFRKTRNYETASTVITASLIFILLSIYILRTNGMTQEGAIIWLNMLLPVLFFIKGKQGGIKWNLIFIALIVLNGVCTKIGIIHTITFDLTLLQVILGLVIMNILTYTYENYRDEYAEKIEMYHAELEQKVLNEQANVQLLEKLSITDELTGLYNRRFFNEVFPKEIARIKREKSILAFSIMDLDNFKKYNDLYGHLPGDNVLKEVGSVFKRVLLRGSDFSFRLGGEEFGLLFSAKSDKEVLKTTIKIKEQIEALNIEHRENHPHNIVTGSFGVYFVDFSKTIDTDMDEIYKNADIALYQAKDNGRNSIAIL